MNAALPEKMLKALETVSLEDKYSLPFGQAFMSGVQALVRLPMLQRQRDVLNGKNTAGFISGYRGSPLGGYDQSLWRAKEFLEKEHIVFQPGVNEELAATAIWGTQQLGFAPEHTHNYDGVFGIWYGKGPGVDRCGDVFKHANMAGTTKYGGVIAVAGDDHIAKSSTAAHQSDQIFMACWTPVFFPASVQDILDYGVHAFALSRFASLWCGMKTIQEIVESSATVIVDPQRIKPVLPQIELPAQGLSIRWPDDALSQEARLFDYKWPAVLAYICANRLNFNVIEGPIDRFGIVASGKAYNDTRQALLNLGLNDETCRLMGIRLHKVGVSWPLEPSLVAQFASGLEEILVVEEKRALIEPQIKEILYGWPDSKRPRVLGKLDDSNETAKGSRAQTLLRASADLNPALVARAIEARLKNLNLTDQVRTAMRAHIQALDAKEQSTLQMQLTNERQPWFCSGCPHNTSTVVPEGSRAMAGIGCHFMSLWMDRSTTGFTQMGGEGTPWIGQQPFIKEKHIFANMGDGTYFHSGAIAIRQSVAAGVNITYKILYNDAVAMTGGQPIGERTEGHSVVQIAQSMRAEGVQKITIVTDFMHAYERVQGLPAGVEIKHRDELEDVQKEFRQIKGTTVIIYDQTCATEKRRRRKRGTLVDPAVRVFINESVCEGCGDCGVKSNCISVEPLETKFGRKRTINQSACNKDLSCLKGFCPSFVTVEGGIYKDKTRSKNVATVGQEKTIPEPVGLAQNLERLKAATGGYGIVVAGVGGTGVITIGQILGFAAHLEGLGIVTQDSAGLAQKGGATWSHVLIAPEQSQIQTTRVSALSADLILVCDPVVGTSRETLSKASNERTRIALNSHTTPTAEFVKGADWQNPSLKCKEDLLEVLGGVREHLSALDAYGLAMKELGDSIFVNTILLGFAWQMGWIPLRGESIRRAIELNAVSVQKNKQAFELGRAKAHAQMTHLDSQSSELANPKEAPIHLLARETLESLVQTGESELEQYQNKTYAKQYAQFVSQVQKSCGEAMAKVVAKNLLKLMAYKDEYEVARLHLQASFRQRIQENFEGNYRIYYYLAPPLLAKRNSKGELVKQKMGPWVYWVFKAIAPLKFLRESVFDPFGWTIERRMERGLISRYKEIIDEISQNWTPQKSEIALKIANIPQSIKGYGHIKEKKIHSALSEFDHLKALYFERA